MKKIQVTLVLLFAVTFANAQVVSIPDINFKLKLLSANTTTNQIAKNLAGNWTVIDTNNDGLIQQSEANNISYLDLSFAYNQQITNLIGINNFSFLKELRCEIDYNSPPPPNLLLNFSLSNLEKLLLSSSRITSISFSGCINLKSLYLNTALNSLNIDDLISLEEFTLNSINNISSLNFSNNINLKKVNLSYNDFSVIDFSNCNLLEEIEVGHQGISVANGFTGQPILSTLNISNCFNLKKLDCTNGVLTSLNLANFNNLEELRCYHNILNTLSLENCNNLKIVDAYNNSISNLNNTGCSSLQFLNVKNNQLTSLDLSSCGVLQSVNSDNNNLQYISFKNNTNETKSFANNPNLTYICADEAEQNSVQYIINTYEMYDTCNVGDYCSFTPNGNFNTISGNALYDNETDGCDTNDEAFEFLRVNINDGTNSGSTFTNFEGNYKFYGNAGTFTLTPQLENPTYFNVSPATTQISFANANNNTASQDFCITPNGTHTDLEVVFAPITPARPGFDAEYNLVFKNKGNQPLSGSVSVAFEDSKMDFLNSSLVPTSNSNGLLSWDYTNLLPFENRSVVLTFNVNSPTETPAVNNGDVLNFNANGTPISGDEIPTDNAFVLHQTVVGSFDPNDIYCLEGAVVDPALIGQYLHYNVRFENTGTAAAENIVVATTINSADYDIDSLQVLNASNPVYTRITGNFVEFIFENIQLAGSPSGGHGHILFKMKSKSNLQNSDDVTSNANIFFDYNFPIETNDATTTFETLNNQEFVKDNSVKIYPNPTASIINISCNSSINAIELFDVQGRLLQVKTSSSDKNTLDLSDKTNGIYFLKITTEKGSKIEKVVKE